MRAIARVLGWIVLVVLVLGIVILNYVDQIVPGLIEFPDWATWVVLPILVVPGVVFLGYSVFNLFRLRTRASAMVDSPARAPALGSTVGVLVIAHRDIPHQRDTTFVAANTRMTVGRGDACDLSLPDIALSRRHFLIIADDQHTYVEDLGSTSGTFLNGELVRGRVALRGGDMVHAGRTEIEFQVPAAV